MKFGDLFPADQGKQWRESARLVPGTHLEGTLATAPPPAPPAFLRRSRHSASSDTSRRRAEARPNVSRLRPPGLAASVLSADAITERGFRRPAPVSACNPERQVEGGGPRLDKGCVLLWYVHLWHAVIFVIFGKFFSSSCLFFWLPLSHSSFHAEESPLYLSLQSKSQQAVVAV